MELVKETRFLGKEINTRINSRFLAIRKNQGIRESSGKMTFWKISGKNQGISSKKICNFAEKNEIKFIKTSIKYVFNVKVLPCVLFFRSLEEFL